VQHVFKPDAAAHAGFPGRAGQHLPEALGAHAGAVVAHRHVELVALDPGGDLDQVAGLGLGEAVLDGVLDERLDDHAGDGPEHRALLGAALVAQPVAEARLLDGDVVPGHAQLLRQRRELGARVHRIAQNRGQPRDHFPGAGRALHLGQRADGV